MAVAMSRRLARKPGTDAHQVGWLISGRFGMIPATWQRSQRQRPDARAGALCCGR